MHRYLLYLLVGSVGFIPVWPARAQDQPKLLIALASFRERVRHPKIYFYEHDGVSQGKVLGSIDTQNKRSDYHPSLSRDGRFCAFASEQEGQPGKVLLWDIRQKKLIDLPKINDSPHGQMRPALSKDGKLLAFSAWNRPGSSPRWDLLLYDVPGKKLVELPGVNTPYHDERMPALGGDGRYLAFISNSKDNVGLTDIWLYDRNDKKVIALPELNSKDMDAEPSLSADGRLVAFISDRPGGSGGRDIYLFDRIDKKFIPLPGLNSVAQEQTPCLSPNGRFIVFVSERITGVGERDVFLYDRKSNKLLPTPGLNDKREDFDPAVTGLGM